MKSGYNLEILSIKKFFTKSGDDDLFEYARVKTKPDKTKKKSTARYAFSGYFPPLK
jgi:hypothetical protein